MLEASCPWWWWIYILFVSFRHAAPERIIKDHKRTRYENTCSLRENITSVAVFCGLFQLLVVRSTWVLLSEGNRNYGKYQCFVWWKVNLLNQKMTSAKYRWKVNGRNLQERLIMITFSNPKHDKKRKKTKNDRQVGDLEIWSAYHRTTLETLLHLFRACYTEIRKFLFRLPADHQEMVSRTLLWQVKDRGVCGIRWAALSEHSDQAIR